MYTHWEYLQWTDEDKSEILKVYDRNLKTVKNDVKSIREWMEKQPHLNKYNLCDNLIEYMLIFNKFRIEVTKKRIDMYFSIRNFFPEIYNFMDNKYLQNVYESCNAVVLPKLTKDHCRILFAKLDKSNSNKFNLMSYIAYVLKMTEIRLLYDCSLTDYYIVDYSGATMFHIAQFTPVTLKKLVTILENVFSLRVKKLYVINASRTVDMILSIVKSIVKPKIAERINVYTDDSILFDILPKSEIPSDYGGDAPSMKEYAAVWFKKLEEVEDWLQMLQENPVNEKLRPEAPLNNDYFGIEGNFKKLNVD